MRKGFMTPPPKKNKKKQVCVHRLNFEDLNFWQNFYSSDFQKHKK